MPTISPLYATRYTTPIRPESSVDARRRHSKCSTMMRKITADFTESNWALHGICPDPHRSHSPDPMPAQGLPVLIVDEAHGIEQTRQEHVEVSSLRFVACCPWRRRKTHLMTSIGLMVEHPDVMVTLDWSPMVHFEAIHPLRSPARESTKTKDVDNFAGCVRRCEPECLKQNGFIDIHCWG